MMEVVTVFGDGSQVDVDLAAELRDRGFTSHIVSALVGWMRSARSVIVRVDTASGASAFEDLRLGPGSGAKVLAMYEATDDDLRRARARSECAECSRDHEVVLLWHPHIGDEDASAIEPRALAAAAARCFESPAGEEITVDRAGARAG